MSPERSIVALADWLATYAVHSTLLLGAAWIVARVVGAGRERAAELVWRIALFAPIASASLQFSLDVEPLTGRLDWSAWLATWRAAAAAPLGEIVAPLAGAATWTGLTAHVAGTGILLLAWGVVATARVARMTAGYRRLRLLLADCRPPSETSASCIAAAVECVPGASVLVSPSLDSPVALGGQICLPERALRELSNEELRAVIAHELAHVRRRDGAWRLAAAVVQSVFFFQPLNGVGARKLRELAECLCDDWAIERTRGALALASALATAASWIRPACAQPLAVRMTEGESLTLRRVHRMLGPRRAGTPGPSPAVAAAAAVAACLAAAAVAPGITGSALGASMVPRRYVIQAHDPAGAFTVAVEDGRVVGATIAGEPLPAQRVVQRGATLELTDGAGRPFTIRLKPGGIAWVPRPARAAAHLDGAAARSR